MKTISEALTNIGGGGGGSDDGGSTSGGNSFVVTMTYDGNEYNQLSADKTNAEIMDAILDGKHVYAVFSVEQANAVYAYRYDIYSATSYPSTSESIISFVCMSPSKTSASGGTMMVQVLETAGSGATNTTYSMYPASWQFTISSQP